MGVDIIWAYNTQYCTVLLVQYLQSYGINPVWYVFNSMVFCTIVSCGMICMLSQNKITCTVIMYVE